MAKKRIATFLAPSKGLSITGSHCYAFSGAVAASGSEQTLLDFTTGNGYIVATLTLTAPIRYAAITGGYIRGWELKFNGQTVGMYKADTDAEDMPTMLEAQILIPPVTAVILTCTDNAGSSLYLGTANLTGRVYDA